MTVFRTLVVPADLAPLARALGAALTPAAAGMFVAPLSPAGSEPATHYVSTGWIDPDYAALITDAEALHSACIAGEASVALAQCAELVERCDVSDAPPFDAFARLGLMQIRGTL